MRGILAIFLVILLLAIFVLIFYWRASDEKRFCGLTLCTRVVIDVFFVLLSVAGICYASFALHRCQCVGSCGGEAERKCIDDPAT